MGVGKVVEYSGAYFRCFGYCFRNVGLGVFIFGALLASDCTLTR